MTSARLLDDWQPPPGAGEPVSMVATSFTFDSDFFATSCLGRFLGLDAQRGEDDPLLAIIEEEERFAEVRAAVVVDRSERPSAHNLRWDVLTVAVPGGLLHAKVTVLVWQRLVRIIVGSANLTPAGYRSQVEIAAAFDARAESSVPEPFMLALLREVDGLVVAAPGDRARLGPKRRTLESLSDARTRVRGFGMPKAWPRGSLRGVVASSRPGQSPLGQLDDVWHGACPRMASVLSPFFDSDSTPNPATVALLECLAQRGEASVRFCLPGDYLATGLVLRAPRTLTTSLPARVDATVEVFEPDGVDVRRLHAKAIVLESDDWVAASLGSSNFTAAGLGLASGGGHRELNVWLGAPADSDEAEHLRSLVPDGKEIDPDSVLWEPLPDDEVAVGDVLPLGFADCLLDPTPPLTLTLLFEPAALPGRWQISLPQRGVLVSEDRWRTQGCPTEVEVDLAAGLTPFWVDVSWDDGHHAPWAVNVTDPSALPPPDQLRSLPVDALLAALASSRPIHEALAAELRRRELHVHPGRDELDPLKRHSMDGLFRRTRRLSAALNGMRERLERPVANIDSLRWRLRGVFGPIALAQRIVGEGEDEGRLPGEASFCIAELAVAVARIDWRRATTPSVRLSVLRAEAHAVIDELADLVDMGSCDRELAAYVTEALAEARR